MITPLLYPSSHAVPTKTRASAKLCRRPFAVGEFLNLGDGNHTLYFGHSTFGLMEVPFCPGKGSFWSPLYTRADANPARRGKYKRSMKA